MQHAIPFHNAVIVERVNAKRDVEKLSAVLNAIKIGVMTARKNMIMSFPVGSATLKFVEIAENSQTLPTMDGLAQFVMIAQKAKDALYVILMFVLLLTLIVVQHASALCARKVSACKLFVPVGFLDVTRDIAQTAMNWRNVVAATRAFVSRTRGLLIVLSATFVTVVHVSK